MAKTFWRGGGEGGGGRGGEVTIAGGIAHFSFYA